MIVLRRHALGFTLIELLIVVAIIAILAAIAVPNFLEAQVRSKVSRTRADIRSVATGLESYAVDNNGYPFVTQNPGYGLPGGYAGPGIYATGITTPITYLTSLPLDPFGGRDAAGDLYAVYGTTKHYWYATKAYYDLRGFTWNVTQSADTGQPAAWVLMSKGPDQAWARNPPAGPGVDEVDRPSRWQYDATNGTVSAGNIVRTGP
jgi:type II secretion system protein G